METLRRIGLQELAGPLPSTAILNGSVFYLRWADPDDTGSDSGLAIDNFTFAAVPEPSVYVLLDGGILLCGQRFLRRKRA